jgi:hypothetical protein
VLGGKFSVRLDANTVAFAAALGTTGEKAGTMFEFLAFDANNDLVLATRFPFRCLNIMDSSGGNDPLDPATAAYEKAEADNLFVAKRANGQGWRMAEDGWWEAYFPDGHWYRETPMIVGGKPGVDWVLVE